MAGGNVAARLLVEVRADVDRLKKDLKRGDAQMRRFARDTERRASGMRRRFGGAMSSMGGSAHRAFDRMKGAAKRATGYVVGSLKSIGQTALRWTKYGLMAAAGAMALFASKAVKTAATAEQTKIAFDTLLGSGKKSAKFLKDLEKFAATTPFDFPELVDQSKRLMAYGFAAKDVIPILTKVGDASAALGTGTAGIDAITRALGQMRAKGKVSQQEMRQLTEANINAWEILGKKFGKSREELEEAFLSGDIDSKQAVDALLAGMGSKFGGLMDKQSKTLLGIWHNFTDQMFFISRDAGQRIIEAFNLKEGLGKVAGWTEQNRDKIVAAIGGIADGIAGFASRAVDAFGKVRDAWGNVREFLAGSTGQRMLGGLGDAADGVAERFRMIGDAMRAVLGNSEVQKLFTDLVVLLGKALKGSADFAKELAGALKPAFEKAGQVLQKLVGWIGKGAQAFIDAAGGGDTFRALLDILKDALAGAAKIVTTLAGAAVDALGPAFVIVAKVIGKLIKRVVDNRERLEMLGKIVMWVGTVALPKLIEWIGKVVTWLAQKLSGAIDRALDAKRRWTERIEKAREKLSNLWDKIRDFGSGVQQRFTDKIDRVKEAMERVSEWFGNAKDTAGDLWGELKDFGGGFLDGIAAGFDRIRQAVESLKDALGKLRDVLVDEGLFGMGGISKLNKLPGISGIGEGDSPYSVDEMRAFATTMGAVGQHGVKPGGAPFAQLGAMHNLRITSGYRPGATTASGNISDHATGNALDFAGAPADMASFYRAAGAMPNLKQRIYSPLDGWSNDHYDHVHVAFFKRGGRVPGAGHGDKVPAMLTPGEFVIRKNAAKALGPGYLHALNSQGSGGRGGRSPHPHGEDVQHFSHGGAVGNGQTRSHGEQLWLDSFRRNNRRHGRGHWRTRRAWRNFRAAARRRNATFYMDRYTRIYGAQDANHNLRRAQAESTPHHGDDVQVWRNRHASLAARVRSLSRYKQRQWRWLTVSQRNKLRGDLAGAIQGRDRAHGMIGQIYEDVRRKRAEAQQRAREAAERARLARLNAGRGEFDRLQQMFRNRKIALDLQLARAEQTPRPSDDRAVMAQMAALEDQRRGALGGLLPRAGRNVVPDIQQAMAGAIREAASLRSRRAEPTNDERAIMEQERKRRQIAERRAEISEATLGAFASPGDIGRGGANAHQAAQGVTINQYALTGADPRVQRTVADVVRGGENNGELPNRTYSHRIGAA